MGILSRLDMRSEECIISIVVMLPRLIGEMKMRTEQDWKELRAAQKEEDNELRGYLVATILTIVYIVVTLIHYAI